MDTAIKKAFLALIDIVLNRAECAFRDLISLYRSL